MIYELREYVAVPGKIDALHARFADHTMDLFRKHGLPVIGFWTDAANPDRIVYLLAFTDRDSQRAAWQAFQGDEEWQRVKRESEADGPIAATMLSTTLRSVPYWAATTTSTTS
jgi:NIPSNAP protein